MCRRRRCYGKKELEAALDIYAEHIKSSLTIVELGTIPELDNRGYGTDTSARDILGFRCDDLSLDPVLEAVNPYNSPTDWPMARVVEKSQPTTAGRQILPCGCRIILLHERSPQEKKGNRLRNTTSKAIGTIDDPTAKKYSLKDIRDSLLAMESNVIITAKHTTNIMHYLRSASV